MKKEYNEQKRYMLDRFSTSKIFFSTTTKIDNAHVMNLNNAVKCASFFFEEEKSVSLKGFSDLSHIDVSLFETFIEEFLILFKNNISEKLKKEIDQFLLNSKRYYYIMHFDISKISNKVNIDYDSSREAHFFVDYRIVLAIASKIHTMNIECNGIEKISHIDANFNCSEMSFSDVLDKYREGLKIDNMFEGTWVNTKEYEYLIKWIEKNDKEEQFNDLIKQYDTKFNKSYFQLENFREFRDYHKYFKMSGIKNKIELQVNYNDKGYFPTDTTTVIVYNKKMNDLVCNIRKFILN